MTENPTGVDTAVAQESASPSNPETTPPQVAAFTIQETDPQARARKEQIDAATASLRKEYGRMGIQIDEIKLSQQVQNLVDDRLPVALIREMRDGDPDINHRYLSAGENYPIAQLDVGEIRTVSELPPYIPGAKLDPARLDRRIVTWLMRASKTAARITTSGNANCVGISVVGGGNSMFCELDAAAGVIRMTQSIATKNGDGTHTDTRRRIAWVYDKKLFTQLEEAAQEWAKQEKFWEHACAIVGVEPSTTGFAIDRDLTTRQYFLVRSSDGERVNEPFTLIDSAGKAVNYVLRYLSNHLMLVSTDQEKTDKLTSAIRESNWPNDIGFDK